MKLFLFVLLSLLFTCECAAQAKLPVEMPEKFSISFNEEGGMSRSYKKIRITDQTIEFEQLSNNGKDLIEWSADISSEDSARLYRIFVENRFDAIENDKRKEIAHDAGSESISIKIRRSVSFHVVYGRNSPLSGTNLSGYRSVRKAITELVVKYEKKKFENTNAGQAEKLINGKWRAAGDSDGHSWFLEWNFEGGNFTQLGYPAIKQTGKYRIINFNGNKMTAELYDQKGTFGAEAATIEILIDQKSNLLTISGTKGFSKVDQD